MTISASPTIESVLMALASSRAFRPADIGFAHGCVARIRAGVGLSSEAARRAYRLLGSYRDEIDAVGVSYDDLPSPDPTSARQAAPARPIVGRSQLTVAQGALWLKSPYEAKQLVRDRIPAAKWDKARVAYRLPMTAIAAMAVMDALGQYGVDVDAEAQALVVAAHEAKGAQAFRTRNDLPPVPGSKTVAWGHQLQAFWFARELPGALLDVEMGGGKSKIVCDLIHDSRAESVLVVCPERVIGVWPKQFGLHCGGEKHIIDPRKQNRRGEWNLLPIAERVELYEHALHDCGCGLPHVLLTNYAAAGHEPFKSWSLRQHFDYVTYDECHRLRSHGGVWSKWAAKMHVRADRHLGGTGTLQAQTPLDVFGQARAVEPGLFGSTYVAFERRYAIKGGYQGYQVIGYQNEDELAAKLATITFRAGEEVLDLPPLLEPVTVEGRLSPRAYKIYKNVEDDMYSEVARTLADGTTEMDEISTPNVLVKILRCQQMTGGALPLDSGSVEEIDTAKSELLADLLEDISPREPVVVFCRFHHDLGKVKQVAERLGRRYAELSGNRSDALAADATLAEGVQVAGVQIQAGGTGVDFTRSAFGIYYSVGHSLSDFLQSRKRLQRPGQTRSVRFSYLVMQGTIDIDVYEALEDRQSVVDRIASKVKRLQEGGQL